MSKQISVTPEMLMMGVLAFRKVCERHGLEGLLQLKCFNSAIAEAYRAMNDRHWAARNFQRGINDSGDGGDLPLGSAWIELGEKEDHMSNAVNVNEENWLIEAGKLPVYSKGKAYLRLYPSKITMAAALAALEAQYGKGAFRAERHGNALYVERIK